jgi:prevent-host-death family protein
MTIAEQMPLAEVKNRLSEVVDEVEREHARVVITKHGRPAAIVLSIDDLESLEETLAVMSSPRLAADLQEALAERDAGGGRVFTKEEALRLAADAE